MCGSTLCARLNIYPGDDCVGEYPGPNARVEPPAGALPNSLNSLGVFVSYADDVTVGGDGDGIGLSRAALDMMATRGTLIPWACILLHHLPCLLTPTQPHPLCLCASLLPLCVQPLCAAPHHAAFAPQLLLTSASRPCSALRVHRRGHYVPREGAAPLRQVCRAARRPDASPIACRHCCDDGQCSSDEHSDEHAMALHAPEGRCSRLGYALPLVPDLPPFDAPPNSIEGPPPLDVLYPNPTEVLSSMDPSMDLLKPLAGASVAQNLGSSRGGTMPAAATSERYTTISSSPSRRKRTAWTSRCPSS